jgi:MFS family permease
MSLKKIFSVYLSARTSAIGWRQFIHSLPTDEGRPMLLTARTPSRYASALAALSVFMAALLLPLSFTGGVMTTPAIQQSLGGSPAALSWLTNGFMLTFGSFLLAAGVTADAIDRKRIFIAGAALFCLSSLLFCLTHNLFLSGVLRALQGLAAAMILASGSAALAQLYDGAQRTRAFSILGTVFGVGLAFGPLVIGFMTDAVGWRGVYALFALLSAGCCLSAWDLCLRQKKRAAETRQPRLTLFTLALMLFTASLMVIPARGFIADHAGLVHHRGLFVAFVVRCQRVNNRCWTSPCCAIRVLSACCYCLSPPAVATLSC